jgi:hypothetical protein
MKGNQGIYEDQDKAVNMILEQTFNSAVAGRTYTFTGDVFIQDGYSGIINTPLNPLYPKGDYNSNTVVDAADYTVWRDNLETQAITLPQEGSGVTPDETTQEDYTFWKSKFGNVGRPAGVPSPTETKFEITFLNASNVELGTTSYDLRSDPTTLAWRVKTDKVVALAPAGATKARLRVMALNMVDNCCALGQDVLLDNFALYDSAVPTANRLVQTNGDLNTPGEPAGWTVTEGPTVNQGAGPVTADSIAFIGFANRLSNTPSPNPAPPFATLPTGQQGLWLRPYVNATQFEPDIVDDFGYASQVVNATPGAQYSFSAWSAWESGYCGGLAGATTQTFMKMEFLDSAMAVIGTQLLDLKAAGQVKDDNSGTNENGGNVEFDDWRQFFLNATAPAGTDKVRVSLGATGMFLSGLGFESAFFDEMSLVETLPGAGSLSGPVPEPGSLVLMAIATALAGIARSRKRRSESM